MRFSPASLPLGLSLVAALCFVPVPAPALELALQCLLLGGAPPPEPGPPGARCAREPVFWDAQLGLGCRSYTPCAG